MAGSVAVSKLGGAGIASQGGQLLGRLLAQRFPARVLTISRGWAREVCNLVDYRQLAKQRAGASAHYRWGWEVSALQ